MAYTTKDIIIAKSDVAQAMPDYKEVKTFEQWAVEQWRYDAERFQNDEDYVNDLRGHYNSYLRSCEAFNHVLDMVYKAIS